MPSSCFTFSTGCSTANSESPYSSIFGPLVALARVLDGELVQAELVRHLVQLLARGLEQRDPDEAVRPADVLADVLDRDVGDLAAVLVRDAADQHGMNGP